jgi:hypothetical protein
MDVSNNFPIAERHIIITPALDEPLTLEQWLTQYDPTRRQNYD